MKAFDNQNYYEILEIPADADLEVIKRAYREALDIYSENALATYSLFSEEQRAELLQTIETAFHTLIDTDKRAAYDQMLLDSGRIHGEHHQQGKSQTLEMPVSTAGLHNRRDLRARLKTKFEDEDIQRLANQVVDKDLISGLDLKRLREALEVKISEIFEITRITKETLTKIEENEFKSLPSEVFLKSFLKSYAEILQIDPQRVIEGYFKCMAQSEH